MPYSIRQAVILAGGMGKRLRPLTDNLPKPMVIVNGKPFVEHTVSFLRQNGIEEVVFLVGYLQEKIINYFGDGSRFGLKIKYSLGTDLENNGSRIRNAKSLLDDKFLLLYGDIFLPFNLHEHIEFYSKMDLPVVMTVYDNSRGDGEYGGKSNVEVVEGLVTYYGDFRDNLRFNGLDLGYFIFDKSLVRMMPMEDFELQSDFLTKLAEQKLLAGIKTNKPYCTITDKNFIVVAERFFSDYYNQISGA